MIMSQKVREEMLPRLRQRYANRGRQGRSRMIDEVCEQFGYSRNHAIKLLGAKAGWGGDPAKTKGRPARYGSEVTEVLWAVWKCAEQPCGKRLVKLLPLWLPHYEAEKGKLSASVRRDVLRISAAQADRLLAPRKARAQHRGRSGTKPGSLLKHHICFTRLQLVHPFGAAFGWLSRSARLDPHRQLGHHPARLVGS